MVIDTIWAVFASPRLTAAGLLLASVIAAGDAAGVLDDPWHAWWFALFSVVFALGVLALSIERLPRQPLAGVWALHAGALLAALGALVDAMWGFAATVTVSQDRGVLSAVETREADGALVTRRLGLFVRCDDARTGSSPQADIALLADAGGVPGAELARATLEAGAVVRQAGITVRGAGLQRLEEGSRARISLLDRSTGARRTELLLAGDVLEAGDARYRLLEHAADREGRGEAVRLERSGAAGSAAFWLFAREPQLDRQRKDRVVLAFAGLQPLHAARLRISRDPGLWLRWTAAALIATGLLATLARVRLSAPGPRIPSSGIESSGC
jgi:hypothetical protein